MGPGQAVVYILPVEYNRNCRIPGWMVTLLIKEVVKILDEIYRGESCGITSVNTAVNRFLHESEKYIRNKNDLDCLAKINHDLHFNVKRTSIIHPDSFIDYVLKLCIGRKLEACEVLRRAVENPNEISHLQRKLERRMHEIMA